MEFNLADLWEARRRRRSRRARRSSAATAASRYAEADERANRLAHHLAAQGIGAGDHVALYLYNGTEYLEGMLAAFKLRAVPINVNYRYVEEELRYLLDDCRRQGDRVPPRVRAEARRRARRAPVAHTFVAVDDGSGAELDALGGRRLRAGARRRVARARLRASAPPTTSTSSTPAAPPGMPKGVMWRAEDIFFGALGGGNLGEAPITQPEEIADRARRAAGALPARVPVHARHRALDGASARCTPAARS